MEPSQAVAAYAAAAGVAGTPALAAALGDALARARAAHPAVHVDAAALGAFLGERVADADLGTARVDDLLVAWGALRGDSAALAAFEALLAQVPAWLRRPAGAPIADEVAQRLRADLLVGPDARLRGYRGRGALHAFLRIAAVRLLWRLEGEAARDLPLGAGIAPVAPPARGDNPARALAGAHARPVVLAALGTAFGALSAKQRTLLRLRYVEGLTDEKIGAIYRVHQSTATRWLAAAIAALVDVVRGDLAARLALDDAALDSVLADVRSRLDLSLGALLGSAAP